DRLKTNAENNTELFRFDPNTVTKLELQRLGLSEKQAQTIINYRNNGGKFRKKSDFKKMYSVSDRFFERVKSWIDLPDHNITEKEP
ncbi:ComEA family DNA-binding protein, partial [Klebsiella pneumoniae]|uniref:ComEA family DNA-binding protein n=1 Tax=Klebsiella pneumoniae TaxID=573 RepID=UPI0027312159